MAFGLNRLGKKLDIAQVSFGIIGFGVHAQRVMLKAFEESKLANLSAIASSSPKKAADLASDFPQYRIYDDYEALLHDQEIHAVYIGLPNHLHSTWSIKALLAGKHVLCDKPIALTTAEAMEVQQAAQRSNCKVLEGFVHRFHSQHREVKKLLQSGKIGDVRLFEGHLYYFFEDLTNIRLKADCGGGGLYDVGCYTVDCARFILEKEPTTVYGTWKIGEKSGVDESACFQLNFGEGVAAHLTFGCTFGNSNRYRIYGTRGSIEVQDAFHVPRNKVPIITIETLDGKQQQVRLQPCNQFVEEIDMFCRWIHGMQVNQDCFSSGIENARIIDAMKRSAVMGSSQLVR